MLYLCETARSRFPGAGGGLTELDSGWEHVRSPHTNKSGVVVRNAGCELARGCRVLEDHVKFAIDGGLDQIDELAHVAGLATDGEKVRRLLAILADAQLAQYRRRYRDLDEVLLQRGPGGKQTGHRHPAMSEEVCGRAATPPRLTRAGGSFEAAGAGWVVRPFPPQQTGLGSLRAAVVRPAYPEFRPATINGYLRLLRV